MDDDRIDYMLDQVEDHVIVCPECDGGGVILTCCDDICNGFGYCIHGDGEEICPVCHGDGEIHDRSE